MRQTLEWVVDFNLKLLRWRTLFPLDLEKVALARCPLFCAGMPEWYVCIKIHYSFPDTLYPPASVAQAQKNVEKLEKLFDTRCHPLVHGFGCGQRQGATVCPASAPPVQMTHHRHDDGPDWV